MAESKKDPQSTSTTEETRQPFVSQEDRPEVRLTLDTPLSELRIRDLREIVDLYGPSHKFRNTLLELLLHDTVNLKSRFTKTEIYEIDLPPKRYKDLEWPPESPTRIPDWTWLSRPCRA